MSLSLDDFNDTDDKLPTLKKDIRSKSENNLIKIY
jgi:surface protein